MTRCVCNFVYFGISNYTLKFCFVWLLWPVYRKLIFLCSVYKHFRRRRNEKQNFVLLFTLGIFFLQNLVRTITKKRIAVNARTVSTNRAQLNLDRERAFSGMLSKHQLCFVFWKTNSKTNIEIDFWLVTTIRIM